MTRLPRLVVLRCGEHTAYMIAGTDIRVTQPVNTGLRFWELWAPNLRAVPACQWLERHQLAGAQFDTRTLALRAYVAAAALEPPPPARPLPKLVKVRAGAYTSKDGEWAVTRPSGRPREWLITGPQGHRELAGTLNDAQRQIHFHTKWAEKIAGI